MYEHHKDHQDNNSPDSQCDFSTSSLMYDVAYTLIVITISLGISAFGIYSIRWIPSPSVGSIIYAFATY